MKLFFKSKDGGPDSNVTGYWLIEWKAGFSIVLLRFSQGSREVFHSHAFNAVSWILRGLLYETIRFNSSRFLFPRLKPYYTSRDTAHRVYGINNSTWALSFRGPWSKTWKEYTDDSEVTLAHGRVVQ